MPIAVAYSRAHATGFFVWMLLRNTIGTGETFFSVNL